MSDRRESTRFTRRVKVRFWRRGEPGEVFVGYTSNLSGTGAFIEAAKPAGRNARLQIEFATDLGGFIVEGQVARSKKIPHDLRTVDTSGMGVRFISIEELLAEILPLATDLDVSASSAASSGEIRPNTDQDQPSNSLGAARGTLRAGQKSSSRPGSVSSAPTEEDPAAKPSDELERVSDRAVRFHPAASPQQRTVATTATETQIDKTAQAPNQRPTFTLRFSDSNRLTRVWEQELQHGGLFIPTPQPPPVDTSIDLCFYLPNSTEPLTTTATVVVVNAPSGQDQPPNLLVGMGVSLQHPAELFGRIREALRRHE